MKPRRVQANAPLISVGVFAVAALLAAVSGCGSGGTENAPTSTTSTTQAHSAPPSTNHARRDHGSRKPKPRTSKPHKVSVPDVVGESRGASIAELDAHQLNAHFTSQSGVALICAGPAPSATVVNQFPEAGTEVRAGAGIQLLASAYVQRGCGSATVGRACDSNDLSMRVTQGTPEFTGGGESVLVGVEVEHVGGGSACSVNSPIDLTIDRQGAPVSLPGNPTSLQLHAALDAGQKMLAGWEFGGWCGSTHDVVAHASLEGLTAEKALTGLHSPGTGCPPLNIYSLYKSR